MARNALYQYSTTDTQATFAFRNDEGLAIPFDALTPEIRHQLMVHGLKQKVADAAAIPRDTETGYAASDADKIAAMMAVGQRLLAGQWNAAAGGGAPKGGILLAALVALYPNKTAEELADYLSGKTAKEKAALRASPKIAAEIERIKTEAGKSNGIDADELLDELAD